jgi:GNAT superfamily N-acetyltransferase
LTRRIEKITASHVLDAFDCGKEPLNRYLKRFALINQVSGMSTTYVGLVDQAVVGYYSLTVGSVEQTNAPASVVKDMPRYPIPVALLARLAVDQRWQKQGIGKDLLKNAMIRVLTAADEMGIRAILVHAKDNEAKTFYERFDFTPSPTDPLHLFIPLKDIII